jgi:hypothetical protein
VNSFGDGIKWQLDGTASVAVATEEPEAEPALDGALILNRAEKFVGRFLVYSEVDRIAHVLWIAHTWLMDRWDSTPRIAFLSPEPGSGKSRCLEVTEPLVPRAVHAVNTSPAYLFRKVSDEGGPPTILYDEIDTVFGPKAKDNEDIRGMLNAGHRKGAVAGRCVVRGNVVSTEELPAYCAVALAGLNDLPDTIMSRAIIIRMRRRAPGEYVEPWRARINGPEAKPIAEDLAKWASSLPDSLPWPDFPLGIEDRNADVWESLLVVADAAGGEWPIRARAAAVEFVRGSKDHSLSLGVLLLTDIARVFLEAQTGQLSTHVILEALHAFDESAWANLHGKPLDALGLSRRLGKYGVKPVQIWLDGKNIRGYRATDLLDPCRRYCTAETAETLGALTAPRPAGNPLGTLGTLGTLDLPDTAPHNDGFLVDLVDLADTSEGGGGTGLCACGQALSAGRLSYGKTRCADCEVAPRTAPRSRNC